MLNDDEMDGGTTVIDGKQHLIVLDSRGLFKEHRPMDRAAARGRSSRSMEEASERVAKRSEAAAGARKPAEGGTPTGGENAGAGGAGGFKPPA